MKFLPEKLKRETRRYEIPAWLTGPVGRVAAIGLLAASGAYGISHANDVNDKQQAEIAALQATNNQNQAQSERQARILGALTNTDPDTIRGRSLKDPQTLPGVQTEATAGPDQPLQASSVNVLQRTKGSRNAWSQICSANKVNVDNKTYVSTAAHCFGDTTRQLAYTQQPEAQNILPNSSLEYAIADPNSYQDSNADRSVLAHVDAVSVMSNNISDWALLRVSTEGTNIAKDDTRPAFDTMPSLTFGELPPEPGESVVTYAMPASNGSYPTANAGEYLGAMTNPDNPGQVLQMVGLYDVKTPSADSCSYGASGSSAKIGGKYATGPLSMRDNITFFSGGPNANGGDDPAKYGIQNRLKIEQQLGIDASTFNTICGYTVGKLATIGELAGGFNSVAELAPPGMK
jgi:hypothetical protein